MKYNAFISYADADKDIVKNLQDRLGRYGVTAWVYSVARTLAADAWQEIEAKIAESDLVFFVVSDNTPNAEGQQRELRLALEKIVPFAGNEKIMPIFITGTNPLNYPDELRNKNGLFLDAYTVKSVAWEIANSVFSPLIETEFLKPWRYPIPGEWLEVSNLDGSVEQYFDIGDKLYFRAISPMGLLECYAPKIEGLFWMAQKNVKASSDKEADKELEAYNKTNTIESHRDTIEINHTVKVAQPELHALTVAVNAYRDGDLRLKYALPDADALAEQVQAKGKGLFNKVHIHTLRDSDVTKEGLAQKFASIGSKMKREDVFLLFVAGHGITDEKEGAYYFLPVDFRYTGEGAVQKQAVSMTDFRNMLANVQAMKSLILLDTCNSGSFAEAIASRGMTEKTAITKLSRAVGRATIVASSKSQVALEGYNGHGAFTWTILEGMKGKASDNGGKITINTLATFIEEELPKLTFKKWGYEQIPQKTLQGMDFQIGIR